MKTAALASLMAVPSLQILSAPGAVAAEKNHCYKTYCRIVDSWRSCGRYTIQTNCYCLLCGGYCSTYYEDGGTC